MICKLLIVIIRLYRNTDYLLYDAQLMFISDHLLDHRRNQGNMTEVITADTWVKR